ncbi:hypothetical protein ALC62_07763, partial [Cyphomyrmex costatus]
LVQEKESDKPLNHRREATPPSTSARSHRPSKHEVHKSSISQQILLENNVQPSSNINKENSVQGTNQGYMIFSRATNTYSYIVLYLSVQQDINLGFDPLKGLEPTRLGKTRIVKGR